MTNEVQKRSRETSKKIGGMLLDAENAIKGMRLYLNLGSFPGTLEAIARWGEFQYSMGTVVGMVEAGVVLTEPESNLMDALMHSARECIYTFHSGSSDERKLWSETQAKRERALVRAAVGNTPFPPSDEWCDGLIAIVNSRPSCLHCGDTGVILEPNPGEEPLQIKCPCVPQESETPND